MMHHRGTTLANLGLCSRNGSISVRSVVGCSLRYAINEGTVHCTTGGQVDDGLPNLASPAVVEKSGRHAIHPY